MPLDRTKIRYVYSGSGTSVNPELSIGGMPSETGYITGTNLFGNVTAAQALEGRIDYRCIYLVNEDLSNSLYNSAISIYYDAPGSVTIALGYEIQDERQIVNIANYTAGTTTGSLTLKYTDTSEYTFTINAGTISNMASQFQSELETILGSGNVTVSGSQLPGNPASFEINFVHGAGNRYHEVLATVSNTLSPACVITIIKSVNGSPINREADSIDVDTTTPNLVTFYTNEKTFGELKASDVLPIWIRRTIPPASVAVESDSFILRTRGTIYA